MSVPQKQHQFMHGQSSPGLPFEKELVVDLFAGGVITLFIISKWRGDWGFLVNGVKVPWRTYTGTDN